MEDITSFREFFGQSARIKVLDFLIDNRDFDYSLTEISKNAAVGWSTLHGFWKYFQQLGVVTPTRQIGRAAMFKLNKENSIVKKLLALDFELAHIGIKLELKKQGFTGISSETELKAI